MIRRLLLASLGAFFVIGFGEPALAADLEVWPPVAQSRWQDVDCGAAKLTTTASPLTCRRRPAPFFDNDYAARGGGGVRERLVLVNGGRCTLVHPRTLVSRTSTASGPSDRVAPFFFLTISGRF
jgi:hypothetical protein